MHSAVLPPSLVVFLHHVTNRFRWGWYMSAYGWLWPSKISCYFIYHWKVCFGEVKLSERAVSFGRLCFKHCQRHNGPEGWVVAPNQPLFVAQHIDQNSAQLQNLQHMSTSTYWPNSSFETSTKLQPPNLDQTLCSKFDQNFSLKNSTKL